LPDTVPDRNAAVLQLQHANCNAIHIQYDVRASLMVARERHFFGDGEVVPSRLVPVHKVNGFGDLAGLNFYRHAVTQ